MSGLLPLKTRKGDRMCVFMLDDAHGSIEVVVFPEAFKQHGHLAEAGKTVCVAGRFEVARARVLGQVPLSDVQFAGDGSTPWRWSSIRARASDAKTWRSLALLFLMFPLGIAAFVLVVTSLSV